MMQLVFAGTTYEAERIVRGPDYIVGLVGELEVFVFRGISDFEYFELIIGEWDDPETDIKDTITSLQAANTELMLAVAELANVNETDKLETQLAIAELASIIMEV